MMPLPLFDEKAIKTNDGSVTCDGSLHMNKDLTGGYKMNNQFKVTMFNVHPVQYWMKIWKLNN